MENNEIKNDFIDKYFDIVQQKIKELILQDKEIKQKDINRFNDEIFNQPDDIQTAIRNYIENAADNNLDIEKIAKSLYDKFKLQVKNNEFATNDIQDVPNKLMGERNLISFENYKKFNKMKHIKTFEGIKYAMLEDDIEEEWQDVIDILIAEIRYEYLEGKLSITFRKILNEIPTDYLLGSIDEDDALKFKNEDKSTIIDKIIYDNEKSVVEYGDATVIEELLWFVSLENLIKFLPGGEEEYKIKKEGLPYNL